MGTGEPWSLGAVRVGLPFAAALVGALIGAFSGGGNRTAAGLAVHFAAGAFLVLVLLHLLPEAGEQAGWGPALAAMAIGCAACIGLTRRTGTACPGCAVGHSHTDQLNYSGSLLAVMALHCLLDGLAIASADRPGVAGELLSLAVLVHKLPEGMAIAAVYRAAGQSPNRALGVTVLVQSGTLLGFLAGSLLFQASGLLLGVGLGSVAGGMLGLVILTFQAERESSHERWNLAMAGTGALLILFTQLLLGGDH